jgi:hypothetical protein
MKMFLRKLLFYLIPRGAIRKSHETREFLHLEINKSGASGN